MVGVQVGMKDGATVGIGDGGEVGLYVGAALGDLVGLAVGVRVLGACGNTKVYTNAWAIPAVSYPMDMLQSRWTIRAEDTALVRSAGNLGTARA